VVTLFCTRSRGLVLKPQSLPHGVDYLQERDCKRWVGHCTWAAARTENVRVEAGLNLMIMYSLS